MNKKTRIRNILIVIGFILVLALCIVLLVYQNRNRRESSNIEEDEIIVESSDNVINLEDGEVINIYEYEGDVSINGLGISHPDSDEIANTEIEPYDECWVYNDASLYANDTVIDYTDEEGNIVTVGVEDAEVANEQGCIVLQMNYSAATTVHPYGVQLFCDVGSIGYVEDGTLYCFSGSGSGPYTYLNGSGISIPGESFVLLGRSWDMQRTMDYIDPENINLCWSADPTETEHDETVQISLKLYDLIDNVLVEQFIIEIKYGEDEAYHLSSIYPLSKDLYNENAVALLTEAATTLVNENELIGINADVSEGDVFIEDIETPYWGEVLEKNNVQTDWSTQTLYGDLYAVIVNTNYVSVGPMTFYFIAQYQPMDDAKSEPVWNIYYIGYDLIVPMTWERMASTNNLLPSSYAYLNYAP